MTADISTDAPAAEVMTAFHRYEAALVAGDLQVMGELFAEAPELVRFGIGDMQVGSAALAVWRRRQPPLPAGRRLFDTRLTPVGPDAAVVTTLFDYPGQAAVGRQSQVWHRTAAGWRIVSAHVSMVATHVE